MKQDNSANNKRIAKNTLLLYVRLLFTMVVGLYTSRVVLKTLGIEDFGIYNVVGGFVTMFTVLSGSLSAAISRFLTFELGKGDINKLKKVFSSSVTIQMGLSLIIIVIAETLGLWFVNCKMVIPEGRLEAANWVYQFSILSFVVSLISVPYNASIISHEKMGTFAYMSVFEASGKLAVAYGISHAPIDRLIFYGGMILGISLVMRLIYGWYCKKNFEECSYHLEFDIDLLKKMFSFAGWNFFGAGSWQLMTQGVNMLLNVYFGVAVNAARGVAVQVDNAVMQFVNNFTTAINPQITKSYASGDREYMFTLIFRGAKYSFFMLLFFAIPIICETDFILRIWLKEVPVYAPVFIRLATIVSLLHVLSNTMITAMLATGNIKKYQIIVGGLGMLVFPLVWLSFHFGCSPEVAYIIIIIVFLFQLIARLYLLKQMINMPVTSFLNEVLIKVLVVTILAFIGPLVVLKFMDDYAIRFFVLGITSIICTSLTVFFVGLSSSERLYLYKMVEMKIENISK